jgi:hypothetical protein
MIRILVLSLILAGMTVAFEMNAGSAQSITGNESEANMTTGTIVTNGTAVNMTNASTPMISNTT